MKVTIEPGKIDGTVKAPASKSDMQRACAAALLAGGTTRLQNPGFSDDDRAALETIQHLGARVDFGSSDINHATAHVDYAPFSKVNEILIWSNGLQPIESTINCGESGLGIRMFTPIASLSDQELTLTGRGSLMNRPMDFFDQVLPQLGVTIKSLNGILPLKVKGPLQPRDIEIDGSLSSQFLTGLIMAFSAAGAQNVTITVRQLKSKPYIDLTLKVMESFGMKVPEKRNYEQFYFQHNEQGGNSTQQSQRNPQASSSIHDEHSSGSSNSPVHRGPGSDQVNTGDDPGKNPAHGQPLSGSVERTYHVEGDWSGAAFLLVAGAISGHCLVNGLDVFSTQADKAILNALAEAGVSLSIREKEIEVWPSRLKAFQFDATDCPDLFPPLAALAAYCEGTSVIEGVNRLKHKESNRGLTIQEEFGKLGIEVTLQDDLMVIKGAGSGGVKGGLVHSRHDHRIAMAAAILGLRANAPVIIEEAGAVGKSFPDFYEKLSELGAKVQISD